MILFCIGDEDTVLGFGLAGIKGQVTRSPDETLAALDRVCARPDIGMLLITEQLAEGIRLRIDQHRLEQNRPLIVEVPGPTGPLRGRSGLQHVVQAAMGMQVEPAASNAAAAQPIPVHPNS